MGNRTFCSTATMQCTEQCARISVSVAGGDPSLAGACCDPAGAVFDETLEELSDIDRQLLLFSSSSNLVAVRWLLALGGNRRVCDSNSTSCLHASCRSGSLSIVRTLLEAEAREEEMEVTPHGQSFLIGALSLAGAPAPAQTRPSLGALSAVDISGWTPLHIAAFMGRRDVAALLLRFGAPVDQPNLAEQTASDLCSDSRTRMVLRATGQPGKEAPEKPCTAISSSMATASARSMGSSASFDGSRDAFPEDSAAKEMRYEPFFVPRRPLIKDSNHEPIALREIAKIGQAIFNRQPGRGLAFLVATGCIRDYPIDLTAFLRRSNVDLVQIGNFLGEAFSISQILRLEFINSITFHNRGVVSSLAKAFLNLGPPGDLQKLDRIVHSLAEVWWRQHDKLDSGGSLDEFGIGHDSSGITGGLNQDMVTMLGGELGIERELTGITLRRLLPNVETLHQLLFSTVMLHWSLHAQLPDARRLSMNAWIEINRGVCGGRDVPTEVQVPIYSTINMAEIEHLQIGAQLPSVRGKGSALAGHACLEGWVRINSSDMPLPPGVGMNGDGVLPNARMSMMLSEATPSSRRRSPDEAVNQGARQPGAMQQLSSVIGKPVLPQAPPDLLKRYQDCPVAPGASPKPPPTNPSAAPPPGMPDAAWLSLTRSLLFLSASPSEASSPFAFVHLERLRLSRVEPAHGRFVIDSGSAEGGPGPVQLVFLLPDGRWQVFDIPELEIEVYDRSSLESWVLQISDQCGSEDLMAGDGFL